jgi:hypothetical protein
MCISAIVEARFYQVSTSAVNADVLNKIANDLIQMYKEHDYCRESIKTVLIKLLTTIEPLRAGSKLLERLAQELIVDPKQFAFAHADNLGFYLAIKH